jgi:hypothetical protein
MIELFIIAVINATGAVLSVIALYFNIRNTRRKS